MARHGDWEAIPAANHPDACTTGRRLSQPQLLVIGVYGPAKAGRRSISDIRIGPVSHSRIPRDASG
jgi:hypothetical protein